MSKVQILSEIEDILTPIFDSYSIRRVVLFGLLAKGSAIDKSDIDLLVDSQLKGLSFVGLIEDLRNVLKREVDLLEVTHIEKGSPIDREIQLTGIMIYEK